MSIQIIGIIGLSVTIGGYLALTDWQTIPFDPCTLYSPYHNPGNLHNLTNTNHSVLVHDQAATTGEFELYGSLKFRFETGFTQLVKIPLGIYGDCTQTTTCDCSPSSKEDEMCLAFIMGNSDELEAVPFDSLIQHDGYDTYKCSLFSHTTICILKPLTSHSHESHARAVISAEKISKVLTVKQLSVASDKCMNAVIPDHHCHWIPYKQLKNGICQDCPPICRSTHKTLHLAQLIVGSSLLLIGYSLVWFTALAISTNLTPKKCQVNYST